METIRHLTVAGSGVLGGQIAWHSAYKSKIVVVYDISDAAIAHCRQMHAHYAAIYKNEVGASDTDIEATVARLRYSTDLADAVVAADLVIEAVPEVPEIKDRFYRELAPLLPAHTVIATNSSTLLAGDFAEATGRPDQFCSLHYANLIWSMNLVEIMAHRTTSDATLTLATRFVIETGMVPIAVQKEQNGYLLNTWLVSLLNSAQTLVTNGVGTFEDVDRTFLKVALGAKVGPFGIIDVVGTNTVMNILRHWGSVNQDEQMLRNAAYVQRHLVDQGRSGIGVGAGYYDYPSPSYQQPGFLDVPDISAVASIVERVRPDRG